MDLINTDAHHLSAALAAGELTAVSLMQATLDRIGQVNGAVNAIVSLGDPEMLMALAREADKTPRKGWLHGIPMAIKDLANAKGFPNTLGSPLFADQMSVQDDLFVQRLRAAGALIIGKTNTPEFGMGSHTFNPVHGATCNPYDLTRSAGGSSGGAASALAARMVAVADGSDMMGSLRNPAGWNNVYGMRPTWGTVPGEPAGDVFLHHLATHGPMARSPRDLAMLLDTMTGAAPGQPQSVTPEPTAPTLDAPLAELKFGWLGDWGGAFPYEDGIAQISRAALVEIEALGHVTRDIDAPFSADQMWDSWITLRSFAFAAGLAEIYKDADTRAQLKQSAQWEVGRGMAMSAMQVNAASLTRSDWYRAAMALFDQVDFLVLPSAQCWPFDVTLEHPTQIAGVQMDTYHRWMQVVIPAGLIGLPVVNIPIGFGEAGLPAGLQIIGPPKSDANLLQFAQRWHEATDWPAQQPPTL